TLGAFLQNGHTVITTPISPDSPSTSPVACKLHISRLQASGDGRDALQGILESFLKLLLEKVLERGVKSVTCVTWQEPWGVHWQLPPCSPPSPATAPTSPRYSPEISSHP